ncbi:hybrid sensor histidine kinase/response regulator [Desulfolithobacter sp.]
MSPDITAALQREIESHRQTRRALHQTEQEWQRTFDAIKDPVIILSPDMKVRRGNAAAQKLLGNGNPLEGRYCHELFAGSKETCRICPVQESRSSGDMREQEVEHRYLGRTFHVTCVPIIEEEKLIGYAYTAKDITLQRTLEKQLIQAQKMEAIATLAGGIAHDFNNILGAILGNTDLLLYRLPGKNSDGDPSLTLPEITQHLQAIKKASNRAKDLVSQILAFSRQSASRRKNISIVPAIKEAIKLLRSSLPATIEIKANIDPDVCRIHADLTQIHQVFMNLCTNAAQAIDHEEGQLEITLRSVDVGPEELRRYHDLRPGRFLMLQVKDNGHGIPADLLERIFDPFFTTREVGEGTGMGLAVIHGIVTSHDGIIDVRSREGKGSEFTVFIPCAVEDFEAQDDVVIALPLGKETILFVDDEEEIVAMRTRMLEYLGYTVLPATSPERALEYVRSEGERIDLVITDQTMPRMTGLHLAREIHTLQPDMPIILCSGFSEAVTPDEARKAGISTFLMKPLDMRLLAQTIRKTVNSRRVE